MHYFVALEQEFKRHFVEPFTDLYGRQCLRTICSQERYQRTHDVLTGKNLFTLGTVRFLGDFVGDERACEASEAIQKFANFLGEARSEFAEVCLLISTRPIEGVPLPQLRNALAHGNESVISRLDATTFDGVRALLFDPPSQVMTRILSNSLRYSEATQRRV